MHTAELALQGGEDPQDALSCRSFFAKEPLIIGLFCGKWPVMIRHPMTIRHPVVIWLRMLPKNGAIQSLFCLQQWKDIDCWYQLPCVPQRLRVLAELYGTHSRKWSSQMTIFLSKWLCQMTILPWYRVAKTHGVPQGEVGGWGRDPFSRNLMSPTPHRKWYLTTGRRFH